MDIPGPEFLESTDIIDWQTESVRRLADEFRRQHTDENKLARHTFEWVRDNIQHSLDFQRTEVTCHASEVLAQGHGLCYAKSHLLAALLRANGIPTGFCYQRLSVGEHGPPFCVHGLNAVYLQQYGWYRMDARGNKKGVDSQFVPPTQQLAFSTAQEEEFDFPEILPQPLPIVIQTLRAEDSMNILAVRLPDVLPNV